MSDFDLGHATEEERGLADLASGRLFGKPVAEIARGMETVGTPLTEELLGVLVLIGRGSRP